MNNIVDENKLYINTSYHKPIYIAADKGYICKKIKNKLKNKNIIYVTPYRKNQNKKKEQINKKNA